MVQAEPVPPYIGSGPYCYANALAMLLGPAGPAPAVIEVLTGSPFGIQLLAGRLQRRRHSRPVGDHALPSGTDRADRRGVTGCGRSWLVPARKGASSSAVTARSRDRVAGS